MFRPAWIFRLLPVSALVSVAIFILAFGFAAHAAPAAEAPTHGVPQVQLAGMERTLLAQDPLGAGHNDVGMKVDEVKAERDEHGHGPAAKGANANEVPTELTKEQVEDFLSILHEQNPGLETRIRKAMAENPEKVNTSIAPLWPRARPLIELKHKNPALFELTLQEIRLTRQLDEQQHRYRNAHDPAAAEMIRAAMRQILADRFDVRSKMIEMKMKVETDQRLQNRDKMIDDELKQRLTPATTRPEPPHKRDNDASRPDAGTPRK